MFLTCVQPFTGGGLQGISHVGVQNRFDIPVDPLFIGVCRGCGVFLIFGYKNRHPGLSQMGMPYMFNFKKCILFIGICEAFDVMRQYIANALLI